MTKKMMTILLMAAMTMVTMTTACSSDDPLSYNGDNDGWSDNDDNDDSGSTTSSYAAMTTFTVNIDKTTAEPSSSATAAYPDGVSAYNADNFGTTVNIDMANPVDPAVDGVTITIDGNHVSASHGNTEGIRYVVTGTTTDGSLTIDGKTDFALNLNNADITNPASTAIDIESKMNAYLVLTGSNKVTDGTTADDSHKGAIFAKGALLVSGSGALDVYGTYNNGIHGKSNVVIDKGVNLYVKSTANHGIKAGADMFINGGIINVEVSAAGAKAINGDYNVTINGGRTTVIATGNGEWDEDDQDTKAAAGIASDAIFYMNDGEVYAKATGSGGKGIKADLEAYITGGKIRIITEGGLYYNNGTTESLNYTGNTDNLSSNVTSSPKGMKIGYKEETDGTTTTYGILKISGGDIMVRTSGNNAEGIESKGTLEISGGTVLVYAHDDAINSTGDLTISGGTVVAVGTNNDGIDSNGDMYLKGGTLIACGASGAEAGIDINEQKKLYITGGNIFGIGGRIDGNLGSTSQGIITTTGSITANGTVSVSDSSNSYTFNMPPVSYNSGTMLISTPILKSGSSYTLKSGNSSTTVTASNTINSGMGGGGMPGGGQPGGVPGGPGGW
ncbi:MAG: carbohydrate-binding domain-containing protein [Prevotella sp.]|nr:carbohydrate-binding domain-containing protein [Prevotella sp.]